MSYKLLIMGGKAIFIFGLVLLLFFLCIFYLFQFLLIASSVMSLPSILPKGLSRMLAGKVFMASCFTISAFQPENHILVPTPKYLL